MEVFTEPDKFRFNRGYLTGIAFFSVCLGIFVTLIFFTRGALANDGSTLYAGLSVLFTFLVSVSISLGCYPFFSFVIKNYNWDKYPLRRASLMLLISAVFPALIISLWVYLFDLAFGSTKVSGDPISSVDYFDHIIIAIIITVFMVLIYELRWLYKTWREGIIEKEKLKREAIEFQYNALTTQLDPHFLFNSLNILSALIRSNDDKALGFIDRFSDVYRYVLNAQNETLVSLNKELKLVDKYLYLQKLRYQDNLSYEVLTDVSSNDLLLPPLSVQLLIENAIKHNVISAAKPLHITIEVVDKELTVSNSFQERKAESSNGVGNSLLIKRYAHLTDREPLFYIKDGLYVAKIPLLDED